MARSFQVATGGRRADVAVDGRPVMGVITGIERHRWLRLVMVGAGTGGVATVVKAWWLLRKC